jgi:hypothetical protein
VYEMLFEMNNYEHANDVKTFEHAAQHRLDGAIGIVTRLRTGQSGFDPPSPAPLEQTILLFSETSIPALGTTQPHMKWILEIIFPRIKQSGGGGGVKLFVLNDEATNEWRCTSISPLCFH